MARLAANLSMMYNEHAFLDRFAAAANDGFKGVEFLFPYAYPATELRSRLSNSNLALALFNTPPGDEKLDERGMASIPGREDEFKRGLENALEYARVIGNKTIHVMAGKIPAGASREHHRAVYLENLAYAAVQARTLGVMLLIEPINTRDIPGFFLNRQDEAHAIVAEVAAPNLKVQMDLYHCQIV
ncbi:MAG: TIM barrel protein, partial [Usitatibacter sp.]